MGSEDRGRERDRRKRLHVNKRSGCRSIVVDSGSEIGLQLSDFIGDQCSRGILLCLKCKYCACCFCCREHSET